MVTLMGLGLFSLVALEYGLRAYKSLSHDGVLHLSTRSLNNTGHSLYGWISPRDFAFDKDDACYGTGQVSYNAEGFRAPLIKEATGAEPVICILGDSTMQGFQLPDGTHLPHLLSHALAERGEKPYVLPLAVGGYGQTQQWMLYEDHCRALNPDVIVMHWDNNDVVNNSYELERYSGPANNNARLRPYLEQGEVVYRAPYPLSLGAWLDDTMVLRAINSVLLASTQRPSESLDTAWTLGWAVAEEIATKVVAEPGRAIALVAESNHQAIAMFKRAGLEMAIYPDIPEEMTCLPRDPHPTSEGHRLMLKTLLETLDKGASRAN